MEPEAVAGDLPVSASPLAQLAAALGPSSNESEGHDPVGGPAAPQGGREPEQDEPEAQEASASDGGVADVLPLAQAARMFAAACEALHVKPHPQVLLSLNELANEAYGPAMLGKRLGKGVECSPWVLHEVRADGALQPVAFALNPVRPAVPESPDCQDLPCCTCLPCPLLCLPSCRGRGAARATRRAAVPPAGSCRPAVGAVRAPAPAGPAQQHQRRTGGRPTRWRPLLSALRAPRPFGPCCAHDAAEGAAGHRPCAPGGQELDHAAWAGPAGLPAGSRCGQGNKQAGCWSVVSTLSFRAMHGTRAAGHTLECPGLPTRLLLPWPSHNLPSVLHCRTDVVDLVLLDWKAWAVLERLQQLVLADNPQLGRAAPPVPHQQDAGTNLQQQLQQPAAVAAQPATHGFLGAVKLRILASRLFSVGQLRLLDLRRTGAVQCCGCPVLPQHAPLRTTVCNACSSMP